MRSHEGQLREIPEPGRRRALMEYSGAWAVSVIDCAKKESKIPSRGWVTLSGREIMVPQ